MTSTTWGHYQFQRDLLLFFLLVVVFLVLLGLHLGVFLLLLLLLGNRFLGNIHNGAGHGVHVHLSDVFCARGGNVEGPDDFALLLLDVAFFDGAARNFVQRDLLRLGLADLGLGFKFGRGGLFAFFAFFTFLFRHASREAAREQTECDYRTDNGFDFHICVCCFSCREHSRRRAVQHTTVTGP